MSDPNEIQPAPLDPPENQAAPETATEVLDEPQPIVISTESGEPMVVGDWPELARIDLGVMTALPFVTATENGLTIRAANGNATYAFAENHGNGIGLYRLTDWTRHPEAEADTAAPIAPDAPAAPSPIAVAPEGAPPAQAPASPAPPRKDAHLDPTKKCPECGRYVSAGHRIGCSYR